MPTAITNNTRTAIVWCVGSVVWLAPRMLREDWFEQAIVTYGTLTGVAAVGLFSAYLLSGMGSGGDEPPAKAPRLVPTGDGLAFQF